MHPDWLSNAYLVADEEGGAAFFIDSGADVEPLLAAAERWRVEPSYVLRALGAPDELAHASIRFGLGRFNTVEEVDYAVEEVTRQVRRLRALNPVVVSG